MLEYLIKKPNTNAPFQWHRHSLSHELRPSKIWEYDLNTEEKYLPPRISGNSMLYLNIPHFIDSCILELEKICDDLINLGDDKIINNFAEYVRKTHNEA